MASLFTCFDIDDMLIDSDDVKDNDRRVGFSVV